MRGIKVLVMIIPILFLACNISNKAKGLELSNPHQKLLIELLMESKLEDFTLMERLKCIDSAFHLSKMHPTDSLALAIIYSKSYLHYKLRQADSAAYYDRLLKSRAQKIENSFFLGKAHTNLGFEYRDRSVYDSAFFHFNRSKNIFENLRDSSETGKRLLSMAIVQQMKSDFFGSKETLTEALTYLDERTDKPSVASIYNELATNHRKLLNIDDAVILYQKAIALSESHSATATFENNLAATWIDDGHYEKAITILTRLSKTLQGSGHTAKYARVLDNLAYAGWLNKPDSGPSLFYEALRIRKALQDNRGQLASFAHLAEYHLKHDPLLSKKYVDTLIRTSRQYNIPSAESKGLKLLMELDPDNGYLKDRYISLKDSMYQEELKVKTQFAKMKYDDGQEKQRILTLEAETAQKKAEFAEQKTQKITFLSLSTFLLIMGGCVYYVLRIRHKKEKLKEVYSTEKRISKKIHDELANDIYGLMSHMEHSKTFKLETVLDTLEDIYKRTRNISHETGAIDMGNFQAELKKLLSRYRNDAVNITVKGLNNVKWENQAQEKKIILYRIVNELLVNMKKHSRATLASFTFEVSQRALILDYVDNGRGIKAPLQKGAGLSNTENRIKNIGGTFSFEAGSGKGVRIRCCFPL